MVSKHTDKRDAKLPAGVTRIDVATGGTPRHGQPWCYAARVMVNGVRKRQRFPSSTLISTITTWIDEQRGVIRQQHRTLTPLVKGTVEADAVHYLTLVEGRLAAFT